MRVVADNYELYTKATTLPLSVADTKADLRITTSDQDSLISDLIWGAVRAFEKRANVCLSSQKWKVFLDKGYEQIELWKYPITAINTIQYYDTDNSLQTVSTADYFSNIYGGSAVWHPRPVVITVEDIPSTYTRDDAFQITFTAGYSTIDYDVKQALEAWVYYVYENPHNPVNERVTFFDKVIGDNRSYGL